MNFAKQHNIKGYSKYRVDEMREYIRNMLSNPPSPADIDNIRGRRNLMNFAKQHNIKWYSKYRVDDLRDYIKIRMYSLPFTDVPNSDDTFTQPRERYQPPSANINTGDEIFEPSQHINPPFAAVSNDYDIFITNPQTDDNNNNVINFSRWHEPEI
jgi:hypothetical protein